MDASLQSAAMRSAPRGARVIDLEGRQVYPGFVAANTVLGLAEIGSVRSTVDEVEVGMINPNVRAEVAVNADSELFPVTRANGVLYAHTAPQVGQMGVIAGRSALLRLDGWTWEDMTVHAPAAMAVYWPLSLFPDYLPKAMRDQAMAAGKDKILALEAALQDARRYGEQRAAGEGVRDLRWEAMQPVLSGELPVFVFADTVSQIQAAVEFAARHKLRMILVGGVEAWRMADTLAAHKVPVILAGTHNLPVRRSDSFDAIFSQAAKLHAAGVEFAIASQGDNFSSANERNLPYQAASAVAYGLPRDEALRAISLYPARLLGVADRIGSLTVGKEASFFIADGDPLEITTRIERAFILGREIDLSSRHTRLYDKYRQKYPETRDAVAP
jgi:imidazolonepropionase-like amidohydrolase